MPVFILINIVQFICFINLFLLFFFINICHFLHFMPVFQCSNFLIHVIAKYPMLLTVMHSINTIILTLLSIPSTYSIPQHSYHIPIPSHLTHLLQTLKTSPLLTTRHFLILRIHHYFLITAQNCHYLHYYLFIPSFCSFLIS